MVKKTGTKEKQKSETLRKTGKKVPQVLEEKLKIAVDQWQTTFDAIKDAISLIDVEGKILQCNKAMSDLLGKPFTEIVGRTCWELVHGTSEPVPGCPIVRMKETRQRETLKLPIGDKWFESTADLIFDKAGKLNGGVHIIVDITKRKRAQEALQESEEKYKTLTENSLTGIFIHQDGRFVFVNDKFAEMHGYKPEELLGKEHLILIHPDEKDTLREVALKRLKGKTVPQRYEVRRHRKDGTTICCEMMASRILFKGRPAIMGNIIDITERKRMEGALLESEKELSLTLDATTEGIWKWNFKTNEMFFSRCYYKMLGYEPGDFPPSYEAQINLIHPDDLKSVRQVADEFLETKSDHYENIFRLRTKTGEYRWIHARGTVVERDDRGDIVRMIGNHKDITEYKKAEEALMREIEERKKAQEKTEKYHTQLRNLVSQMVLIEENERRRIANVLHDSIGQNLALSRILLDELQAADPSGPLSLSLDELNKIIDEAINSTRNLTFEISSPILYELGVEAAIEWLGEKLLRRRNILFDFRNDRNPKPLTKEAQVLLFQAVREFYLNIIKHSQAHHVRVIIQKLGSNMRIIIEDDGIGFDTKTLHSQVSESLTYGLFSVCERISLIGGSFGIESTPGQGTSVTLIAPLAA